MDFNAALDTVQKITTGIEVAAQEPPYPDFPLAEHGLRYARIRALMEAEDLDVLVLASEESVRYVSGYDSFIWAAAARWLPGALVVPRDPAAARLVVSVFDAGAAAGTAWTPVDPYQDPRELPAKVLEHVRRATGEGAHIGLETAIGSSIAIPLELINQLVAGVGPPADASVVLSAARMIKSPAEIERLRTAAQAAVKGYAAAIAGACPRQRTGKRPPVGRRRHRLHRRRRPHPRLHVGHHPDRRRRRGRGRGGGLDERSDCGERRYAHRSSCGNDGLEPVRGRPPSLRRRRVRR
jgi:hypothetical protein